MAVKTPSKVYEMKYHVIKPLAHAVRAIVLHLSTFPCFLRDLSSTGSKNECEWKKMQPSALVSSMLGSQWSIIISMRLPFTTANAHCSHTLSHGAINAGRGTVCVLFFQPCTLRVCFGACFHLSSKVHCNLNQQSPQPSCAIKFPHSPTVIPLCVVPRLAQLLLPHLIF